MWPPFSTWFNIFVVSMQSLFLCCIGIIYNYSTSTLTPHCCKLHPQTEYASTVYCCYFEWRLSHIRGSKEVIIGRCQDIRFYWSILHIYINIEQGFYWYYVHCNVNVLLFIYSNYFYFQMQRIYRRNAILKFDVYQICLKFSL